MSLICGNDLESNSKVSITWTNPQGNPITESNTHFQDDRPKVVQINIKNASRSDSGKWTCSMEVSSSSTYDCNDRIVLDSGQNGLELPNVKKRCWNSSVTLDVLCKCHISCALLHVD